MLNTTTSQPAGFEGGQYLLGAVSPDQGLFRSLLNNPRNLRDDELAGRACTKCSQHKSADQFNLRVGPRKDGTRALYPVCRPCCAVDHRSNYIRNAEAVSARNREYRAKHAERYKAYDSRPERRVRRVSKTRQETCSTCGLVGGSDEFVAQGSTWRKDCRTCRKAAGVAKTIRSNSLRYRVEAIHKRFLDAGLKVCNACGSALRRREFYSSRVLTEKCPTCRQADRAKAIGETHAKKLSAETLPESKECTRCKVEKPSSEFRTSHTKHKEKTLVPTCRACDLEKGAEYRAKKTPEQRAAENKFYVMRRKVADAPKREAKAQARAAKRLETALRTVKVCTICSQSKKLEFFSRVKRSLDGHGSNCKACQAEDASRRRALDPEGYLQKMRERNAGRREQGKAKAKARQALLCHPEWSDSAQVSAVFAEAERLTKETGVRHAVDHIYPLVSPDVCGLHVACNLRVVTFRTNSKKLNKLPGFLAHELWNPEAANVFYEVPANGA